MVIGSTEAYIAHKSGYGMSFTYVTNLTEIETDESYFKQMKNLMYVSISLTFAITLVNIF